MSSLIIRHFDVGQGDCTVILYLSSSHKRSILLDCGFNQAHKRAKRYIENNDFDKLDVILVTHYDKDHILGVIELLENHSNANFLSATHLYDIGPHTDASYYPRYIKAIDELINYQIYNDITPIKHITSNIYLGSYLKPDNEAFNKFKVNLEGTILNLKEELKVNQEKIKQLKAKEPEKKKEIDTCQKAIHKAKKFLDLYGNCIDEDKRTEYVVKMSNALEKNINIPHTVRKSQYSGKTNGYQCLYKTPQWPLGIDVANYGFEHKIEHFKLEILITNLYRVGKKNRIKDFHTADNACGMGLILTYGLNFRYWFGGDLESKQEDLLTKDIGKLTVLKAGHHGSHHSSSPNFLNKTKPEIVIVSTASTYNENVELPHLETLERFRACKYIKKVYLTGLPYSEEMVNKADFKALAKELPFPNTPYVDTRKFFVAGTEKTNSSDIVICTDKEQVFVIYIESKFPEIIPLPILKKRKSGDTGLKTRYITKKIVHLNK